MTDQSRKSAENNNPCEEHLNVRAVHCPICLEAKGSRLEAENLRLREKIKAFDVDPYPETIFLPMTDKNWGEINEFCKSKGWAIDRLSAEIGRKLYRWVRKEAQQALSDQGAEEKK